MFVAGDLLWYPVKRNNKVRVAPDAMVVFGRPKGYRGSYRQWVEDGVTPQVVFEVLSPSNRAGEMARKALWYDRYGVEEYYIYDPDRKDFAALVRSVVTGHLEEVPLPVSGYVSPRLGVRFDLSTDDLVIYRPDGEPFQTYGEVFAARDAALAERDAETVRADAAQAAAARLAAKLRALGVDPDAA